jgi:hypothetical protein
MSGWTVEHGSRAANKAAKKEKQKQARKAQEEKAAMHRTAARAEAAELKARVELPSTQSFASAARCSPAKIADIRMAMEGTIRRDLTLEYEKRLYEACEQEHSNYEGMLERMRLKFEQDAAAQTARVKEIEQSYSAQRITLVEASAKEFAELQLYESKLASAVAAEAAISAEIKNSELNILRLTTAALDAQMEEVAMQRKLADARLEIATRERNVRMDDRKTAHEIRAMASVMYEKSKLTAGLISDALPNMQTHVNKYNAKNPHIRVKLLGNFIIPEATLLECPIGGGTCGYYGAGCLVCPNKHMTCSGCAPLLTGSSRRCPQCRDANLEPWSALDALITTLTLVPCPHDECDYKNTDVADHVETCSYRPLVCPFDDCKQSVIISKYDTHVTRHHANVKLIKFNKTVFYQQGNMLLWMSDDGSSPSPPIYIDGKMIQLPGSEQAKAKIFAPDTVVLIAEFLLNSTTRRKLAFRDSRDSYDEGFVIVTGTEANPMCSVYFTGYCPCWIRNIRFSDITCTAIVDRAVRTNPFNSMLDRRPELAASYRSHQLMINPGNCPIIEYNLQISTIKEEMSRAMISDGDAHAMQSMSHTSECPENSRNRIP